MLQVALLNACTVLTDAEIAAWLPALQTQLDRDYAPHWTWSGSPATLSFVPKGQKPPADHCWLGVFDTSDTAGAAGWHDYTSSGLAFGKVFAATDIKFGMKPPVTASHELLELMTDLDISVCIQYDTLLLAREICDAVEDDQFGYDIGGIWVSDFVLPRWFDSNAAKGIFDFCGHVKEPRTLLTGGYQLVLDLDHANRGWQQWTATAATPGQAHRQIPAAGSRRERRMRRHRGGELLCSTVDCA